MKSKTYLLLLKQSSTSSRRELAKYLKEHNVRIIAQYGKEAIEVLADENQLKFIQNLRVFIVLDGPMVGEHRQKLTRKQSVIIDLWNTRFSQNYRKLKKDYSNRETSWTAKGFSSPAPYSAIDAEQFREKLKEFEKKTRKKPFLEKKYDKKNAWIRNIKKDMTGAQFTKYERHLSEIYKDTALAYHLTRIAYNLGPKYYYPIAILNNEFIDFLKKFFEAIFAEDACWKMTGEISVGIVFVESSKTGGPKFSSSERNEICDEIIDGLNWLASQHPANDLSWVYDLQFPKIDAPNGTDNATNCPCLSALEAGWRDPAMAQINYNGNTYSAAWSSVAEFREDMRLENLSKHAIVIFVTPYANCWHAYAGQRRLVLAKRNNWGNWSRAALDSITAHEVCHLFGAADEYTGSGTPCSSCDTVHGCFDIPNGNCGACATPFQTCVMDGNALRLCEYTKGQIGWADLFVELTTSNQNLAGTDDDVWLDIGDRTFVLDTLNHNDRESGNREGYAIWAPDLSLDQIKRIMIRKSSDGFAGGWRLKQVRVWFRGELICDQNNINKWLEDEDRTWVGCVVDTNIVNTLRVKVTTADVMWAGTDDNVTVTLAGRNWNIDNPWHNDFERNNTDAFDLDPGTGLYVPDINSVTISKSPDGIAGGWNLKGIEIIINGISIYNNQSINKWLQNNDRTWSTSF